MQFTIVQCTSDVPVKTVTFHPPGGTIGRSQDNDLVLPDEARSIFVCRRWCTCPVTESAA